MSQGLDLVSTQETITDRAVTECNCRLVEPGTVLLSFKLSVGKVGVAQVPMYTNEAIAHLPIRDPNRCYAGFLRRALQATDLGQGADRAAMGATLNTKKLHEIKVPLPPIEEQRRIAAVLDEADELRVKRRASLALLDDLAESIFLDMFGDNSNQFVRVAVGELAAAVPSAIRSGPFGSQLLHSEFVDQGVAVLGIDNAAQNHFTWAQPRFITPEKFRSLRRYEVRPADVLVTLMGTCGRVAIVPDDIPTSISTKHLCCITLDQELCRPIFLWACFMFDEVMRRQLGATARGAVMPGLNMALIKSGKVPLPNIELQRRFEHRLLAVGALRDRSADAADETDGLFASLQHRAFSGAL